MWTGSISFGLVNVPVMLVSASRDTSIRFRQLHKQTHRPIEVKRFCSKEDVEVPWDEVARGYETEGGDMILVTDSDLEAVAPRATRTIDVEAFVPLEQVDPIHFDHPYFLLPMGDSEGTLRAYELLVGVMEAADRAALGRFVMRTKEYLVLVRARGGRLALTTLLWADEVRPTKDIAPEGKAKTAEVDQCVALIEGLSVEWDHSRYEDRYRTRLENVIEEKRKGGTIKAPEPEKEPSATPDLMAALEESLAKLKGDRLEDLSKKELQARAADKDIEGRSSMTKDELVDALS
jgi:DNA end-binding protein Ku